MRLPYDQILQTELAAKSAQEQAAINSVAQGVGQAVYGNPVAPAPAQPVVSSVPTDVDNIVYGDPTHGQGVPSAGAAALTHDYSTDTQPVHLPDSVGASDLYDLDDDHTTDYKDPFDGLSSFNLRYYDLLAKNQQKNQNAQNLKAGAMSGLSVNDQDEQRKRDSVNAAQSRMWNQVGHLPDDQFNQFVQSWADKRGMRMKIPQYHRPDSPNALQLLLGALAARHAGVYAPGVFGQVFKAQTDQNDNEYNRQVQQYQLASQQYEQDDQDAFRIQGMRNQRDLENAQFGQEQWRSHQQDTRNVIGSLDGKLSPTQLKRNFAQLDAIGEGEKIPQAQRDQMISDAENDIVAQNKKVSDKDRFDKDISQMNSLEVTLREGSPSQRVLAAQSKLAILQRWYPGDPQIDALQKAIPLLQTYSRKEEDVHAAAQAKIANDAKTYNLSVLKYLDSHNKQGDEHEEFKRRIAWFDKDHQMDYAVKAMGLKNVQSEIGLRGLQGDSLRQKAAQGLDDNAKSLLATEQKSLKQEQDALNQQLERYTQTNTFSGGKKTTREGYEGAVKDITARLQYIRDRNAEISSGFATSRKALASRPAPSKAPMSGPIVPTMPSGWGMSR